MNSAVAGVTIGHEEYGLAELLRDALRLRLWIGCVALVCALAGVVTGLVLPKEYEATITISPVMDEGSSGRLGGLSSLAAQYGGLASLAGINLPGKDRKDESLAVLQSEQLTESYIRDNNLLPILFWRDWDAQSQRWTRDDPPTVWKGNQYFKKNVRQVTDDKKSGMVIMTIRWHDAQLAAKWANDLVKITNSFLRSKAIAESDRNIAYLNEQAAKTNVIEVQKAVYSLLEEEINKEMIAKGRDEYALKVVDPAFVPEKPSSWGPKRLGAVGFFFGLLVSIVYLLGRRVFRAD
jgi:uncharacterized protein involved in exopolysaccharide biosynthesis